MRYLLFALVLLMASPAAAQLQFASGVNCTPAGAGVFTSEAGRGCLTVEASTTAFAELRDALTDSMADAGGGNVVMPCTQCSVDKGITGCASTADVVTVSRQSAALHRVACILTSIRDAYILRGDLQAAEDAFSAGADIGNGDPQ